jgi:hypothetical protein
MGGGAARFESLIAHAGDWAGQGDRAPAASLCNVSHGLADVLTDKTIKGREQRSRKYAKTGNTSPRQCHRRQ